MDASRCVRAHLHTITDTVESVFDAADPRLHPHAVAGLHAVVLRRPAGGATTLTAMEAYTAAAAAAGGWPAAVPPRRRGQSLRAVREWAAATGGVAVDVITATATSVRMDADARGGRRVVLFRSPAGGGYCPAVAARGDRLPTPLPPPRPSSTRVVPDVPLSPAVAVETDTPAPHWTHRYLTADVPPAAAEPWRAWPDLMATLSGDWGAAPAAPPCPPPPGVAADARLDALAARADYHQTGVRVRYRGGVHFRLLPRACAAAHGGARVGRAVYVEVGDDGGRLWHSPAAPAGRKPYMDVYVDAQEGKMEEE